MIYQCILLLLVNVFVIQSSITQESCDITNKLNENYLLPLSQAIIPKLEGKRKGEAGRLAVVGGSTEYTGAPYFAAISALKVGADLVSVITTESAAPVIKSYSPDLIVIPYTHKNITSLLYNKDVIIMGPGLGREPEALNLAYDVISICRALKKPLVIDADGLYAIYKNITILKNYPSPGVILTPNKAEANRLIQAIPRHTEIWYKYWSDYVTVLEKGETDKYYSSLDVFNWTINKGGSGRRAAGQGDILAGALGTFFNWALKANICDSEQSVFLAQSVASYAAATFTRACNQKAFEQHGRSMLASDMLNKFHITFEDLFT